MHLDKAGLARAYGTKAGSGGEGRMATVSHEMQQSASLLVICFTWCGRRIRPRTGHVNASAEEALACTWRNHGADLSFGPEIHAPKGGVRQHGAVRAKLNRSLRMAGSSWTASRARRMRFCRKASCAGLYHFQTLQCQSSGRLRVRTRTTLRDGGGRTGGADLVQGDMKLRPANVFSSRDQAGDRECLQGWPICEKQKGPRVRRQCKAKSGTVFIFLSRRTLRELSREIRGKRARYPSPLFESIQSSYLGPDGVEIAPLSCPFCKLSAFAVALGGRRGTLLSLKQP